MTIPWLEKPLHSNHLLHIAGLLSTGLYICLGTVTQSAVDTSIGAFLLIMCGLGAISALLYKAFTSSSHTPSIVSIVLWGVVFRAIGMAYGPIYEDDFYRYLWDGYQFFHNGTPYGTAPAEFFQDANIPHQFQQILDGINYPDTPTIYAPVLQYSFLLGYLFMPGEVLGLQLIYSLADLILILLLSQMASRPALILYAWCPLIIKEVAFTAHPDVLGVCLLIGSLFALQRERLYLAALLLGLSVCTKVFALLLAPLILLRCKPQHWLVFLMSVAMLYAPFLSFSNADMNGLAAFSQHWQFNGSVHALLSSWQQRQEWPDWAASLICLLLFGVFYAVYAGHYLLNIYRSGLAKQQSLPRGDWLFAVFFLLAPVVNAWYLIWLLAFATLYPSRWAWVASLAVLLSYLTGATLGTETLGLYQQPLWARVLEYSVILIALGFDIRAHIITHKKSPTLLPGFRGRISVIRD